jgi:hypothetical protein
MEDKHMKAVREALPPARTKWGLGADALSLRKHEMPLFHFCQIEVHFFGANAPSVRTLRTGQEVLTVQVVLSQPFSCRSPALARASDIDTPR